MTQSETLDKTENQLVAPCDKLRRCGTVFALTCLTLALVFFVQPQRSQGQSSETPLYEREPFDRITLDAANDSAVVEVFPIASIRSGQPDSFQDEKLNVRRLQDAPDVRYSVDGKHITKVERYQDMLLHEAKRAIASKDIHDAFHLLSRLNQIAPNMPGMKAIEEAYFFADTRELFRKKRYDESLLSLDHVFTMNPQRKGLDRVLNGILSQVMVSEFAAENYQSVRNKLDFAKRKYGSVAGPLVDQWEKRLRSQAEKQLSIAKIAFARGDSSQALLAMRRASETWPSIQGIAALKRDILAKFPRIRVGVTQPYAASEVSHSAALLLNWANRRSGPLLHRRVLRLDDYTVDGGQYRSDLGKLTVADDRTSLELTLLPGIVDAGHRLTHQMLLLADPGSTEFSPRWAEYVQDIYLNPPRIRIQLSRPTLRPETLLPRVLGNLAVADLMRSEYRLQASPDAKSAIYIRATPNDNSDVSELSETQFDDPTDACQALVDGRLDVVDRIHPGDYDRYSENAEIRLIPYRLPTIHGLVFSDRKALLRSPTFRRSLLYGLDRQTYVDQELASRKKPIARILSGFAPPGRSENDPLGYAYNPRIEPRAYDPSLASVLLKLALRNKKPETDRHRDSADESKTTNSTAEISDRLPKLTLAFPDSHLAASACQAIASDWRRLGLEVTLRTLSPGLGTPPDSDWDVLYLETTVEEPLADLPELVLGHQILGRHGGLVWHAMRQLQDANSMEAVRNQFAKIHRLTFDHTPILPLWQIIEHAAVRNGISGIGDSPVSLYQNLDQWRLAR